MLCYVIWLGRILVNKYITIQNLNLLETFCHQTHKPTKKLNKYPETLINNNKVNIHTTYIKWIWMPGISLQFHILWLYVDKYLYTKNIDANVYIWSLLTAVVRVHCYGNTLKGIREQKKMENKKPKLWKDNEFCVWKAFFPHKFSPSLTLLKLSGWNSFCSVLANNNWFYNNSIITALKQ